VKQNAYYCLSISHLNAYLTNDDSESMLALLHFGKQNQCHLEWTDQTLILAAKEWDISSQPNHFAK
jgi:hypothetical protein